MIHKVLVLSILPCIVLCNVNETSSASENTTAPVQEMYVIHATHYEVGIVTNNSDLVNTNNSGVQEAVTIFKSNGSLLNLTNITSPVLANITKDSILGVAPVALSKDKSSTLPWSLQMAPVSNGTKANPDNGGVSSEVNQQKPQSDVNKASSVEKAQAKVGDADGNTHAYLMPSMSVTNNGSDKLVSRANSIGNK